MLHCGENLVDGILVIITRKRVRCINLRLASNGEVHLSIPFVYATLSDAENFLREKWDWVLQAREKVLSRVEKTRPELTSEQVAAFYQTIQELCLFWQHELQEPGVIWRVRRMKSQWGSCHFKKRILTFNLELARMPREIIEYVVVHEFTHLKAFDHGDKFYDLMNVRLPNWIALRRKLNSFFKD